jgi:hypothetical protein
VDTPDSYLESTIDQRRAIWCVLAEHNAVLDPIRGGGQISFATRRVRKDSTVIDVRIDTSALIDGAGEVTGWSTSARDR